ncbi:MAG: hypothetical protein U0441_21680 [Polyangiaceae bacterium]
MNRLADHRSWILAAFAATNLAACAAMNLAEGTGGTDGHGGRGGGAGSGGSINYDAGGGASTIGDYSQLCGGGTCDVAAPYAVSTCATSGMGGTGGATSTAGAGGSTNTGTGGVGGSTNTGTGGVGGSTATGTGGVGGSTNTGTGGVGGSTNTGGAGGVTNTGGAGGVTDSGTGGAPMGEVQCKVTYATSEAARTCVEAGNGAEFAPCNSALDCGPGLGCVLSSDQSTGVCRYYCCGDTEKCLPNTYCAPRPMAEAADPDVQIPVCVDADNCTLLADDQCDAGTVCTVVRADGTTSCQAPGAGKQGDSCPCAAGYACTKLKNQCHKICHTDPGALPQECGEGYSCQGNNVLPDGFGLCISTSEIQ